MSPSLISEVRWQRETLIEAGWKPREFHVLLSGWGWEDMSEALG